MLLILLCSKTPRSTRLLCRGLANAIPHLPSQSPLTLRTYSTAYQADRCSARHSPFPKLPPPPLTTPTPSLTASVASERRFQAVANTVGQHLRASRETRLSPKGEVMLGWSSDRSWSELRGLAGRERYQHVLRRRHVSIDILGHRSLEPLLCAGRRYSS